MGAVGAMVRGGHVTFVASLLMLAQGQIYKFDEDEAPAPKSLQTMHAFYVYSHADAPDQSLGYPFVSFQSFKGTFKDKSIQSGDYQSVQVSILPYSKFWQQVDRHKFCSDRVDVSLKVAKQTDQLLVKSTNITEATRYIHTVPFTGSSLPTDSQARIRETGIYMLGLSNCGDVRGITVSGRVTVKNAYGFLPANEYRKMPFYGWLALAYTVLAFTWTTFSLRWWRELFTLHYCIAAVLILGLIEAFAWFAFFKDWNYFGVRSRILFILAIMSTVVKSVFSYMLALVASLGWGVTRPYLDRSTLLKVQGLTVLYIILDFLRQTVLSFRHSHTLTVTFVAFCLLPVAVINGVIFHWIFTELSNLIETLKERNQTEKLHIFQRMWTLIVVALTTAAIALLFQIFDLSRSINTRWHYEWFFADAVAHIIFFLVVAAMMYLWAPHMHSKRYAYSQASTQPDEESQAVANPDNVLADEDLGEEEEDESLRTMTHGKSTQESKTNTATPTTIGVAATEEEVETLAAF